ncbi:cytochrome P450 9e2-like [Melitaea cinxia]|uniref:cytochrome P450 9e2-like n=1 Tax=Melitaea cinxia TaxID=113334 RepID=UPI001E26EFA2|nr:cytochrome P450 9e2-like [Melitaea cinxia]
MNKEHFFKTELKLRQTYPEERFVGQYIYTKPVLVLQDLELIRNVTVIDFDSFVDRNDVDHLNVDPFTAKNLYNLKANAWKNMRSIISPAFSSFRIKNMIPLMEQAAESIVTSLLSGNTFKTMDVDVSAFTSSAVMDVMANCVFGLKINSLTDPENEFIQMGNAVSNLNDKWFKDEYKQYFMKLVLSSIRHRQSNRIHRPDMIHHFGEARRDRLKQSERSGGTDKEFGFASVPDSPMEKLLYRELTDFDLVSQAVSFFANGYDTVSSTLSFALHELALQPEIQERLAQEIKLEHARQGNKVTLQSIQNMEYMDMVISETLRLWPPRTNLQRLCTKDINIGKPNPTATADYIVRRGETITIPIWAIHRDPNLFPNPNKFDPERFSEENKAKINPMSYMPFGAGSRSCIGSKFALCELKVLLYYILLSMEVYPSKKTCISSELALNDSGLQLKGGHWLKFKVRPQE